MSDIVPRTAAGYRSWYADSNDTRHHADDPERLTRPSEAKRAARHGMTSSGIRLPGTNVRFSSDEDGEWQNALNSSQPAITTVAATAVDLKAMNRNPFTSIVLDAIDFA